MPHPVETRERALEMRKQGHSYTSIAKVLKVMPSTAKCWCDPEFKKQYMDRAKITKKTSSYKEAERYRKVKCRLTIKAAVIERLGGQCSCNLDDCWHAGQCDVTDQRVLTVDHIDNDGKEHRQKRYGDSNWNVYLKAVEDGSYRMRLLCHNCHHVKNHKYDQNGQMLEEGEVQLVTS